MLNRTNAWAAAGLILMLMPGAFSTAAPAQRMLYQDLPIPVDESPLAEAERLRSEAISHYRRGDVAAALDAFQEALGLYRRGGDRGAEAATLSNLGAVYQGLGDHERAEISYEQALVLRRELGDVLGVGLTLNNLGALYRETGQYQRAEAALEQALSAHEAAGDRRNEGETLVNLGALYQDLGAYDRALNLYERGLDIARGVGDRRGEGLALNNQGALFENLGRYQDAFALLDEALAIRRELGDRIGEAVTLDGLGSVLRDMGQNPRALPLYEEARDLWRTTGIPSGEATTLHNLAGVQLALGDGAAARGNYERALAIRRSLADRLGEGATLNNLGLLMQRQGEVETARSLFDQALVIARDLSSPRGEWVALSNLGGISERLGDRIGALERFRESLGIAQSLGDRAAEAVSLSNLGSVYLGVDDLQGALDVFQQAIALQEELRGLATIDEFRTGLAEPSATAYQGAAYVLARLGRFHEAFDLSERARARTLLDQLGTGRVSVRDGVDSEFIQREQGLRLDLGALRRDWREAKGSRASTEVIQSLDAQILAKQREYESVLTLVKLHNAEYASLVSVSPVDVSRVQQSLDSSTTLVSFFLTPQGTLVFWMTQRSFAGTILNVTEGELASVVGRREWTTSRGSVASLAALSSLLIAPIEDQLRTPAVGIIAHGILQDVPFAALPTDQGYFGSPRALFYLPSASALPFILEKRKQGPASALVLAQAEARGYTRLPGADAEARDIAALYGTEPLLDATEADLKGRAGGHTILHVAAHGEYNPANPLFSRLILGETVQEDGFLEVHEVYGLDLSQTDLVVLSACETQLGFRSRGDDVIGFNRAFIYAGAPTVVATLWKVPDRATAELVRSFHVHLRSGMTKAEALQAAQEDIRSAPDQWAHPFYWAAFVLTGDPGARS